MESLASARKQELHDTVETATTTLDNPIFSLADKVEAINALPDDLPDLAVPASAIDRLEAAEAITAEEAKAFRDLAVDGVVVMPQKMVLTALVSTKDATERSTILSTIDD